MKENKPTIRDISKILGVKVAGWNDKRKNGGRIKLISKLELVEENEIFNELSRMYPNYTIEVRTVKWRNFLNSREVTGVFFTKKPEATVAKVEEVSPAKEVAAEDTKRNLSVLVKELSDLLGVPVIDLSKAICNCTGDYFSVSEL